LDCGGVFKAPAVMRKDEGEFLWRFGLTGFRARSLVWPVIDARKSARYCLHAAKGLAFTPDRLEGATANGCVILEAGDLQSGFIRLAAALNMICSGYEG